MSKDKIIVETKPIVEFLKEKPKYLQLVTDKIPAWKDNYGYDQKETKAKDTELCVISIYQYTKETVQIGYIDSKHSSQYMIVPNQFLVSILSPEQITKLEKKYGIARDRAELKTRLQGHWMCGSDPEIFVEDKDGQLIPAFKFLPDKNNPLQAEIEYDGGWEQNKLYWDGFQAEFTTRPSSCFSGQADSVYFGLQGILKAARKFDKHAKLSFRPVMEISPELLAEAKPEHVQFGCMPSLNAYDMHGLELPGHEVPFRPAGGHMHLGLGKISKEQAIPIVKAMDAVLGVACVSMFAKFDDARRRKLYGLAGEYRLPEHGLEYRVLSNAWLIHPLIAHIVWDLGRTAAMAGKYGVISRWECPESETIRIINECDFEAARKVLTHNREFLLRLLEVKYMNWWSVGPEIDPFKAAEYALSVIMNGLESVVADPTDIEGNWQLLGVNSEAMKEVKWKTPQEIGLGWPQLKTGWQMHSDGPAKCVMMVFKYGLEDKKV